MSVKEKFLKLGKKTRLFCAQVFAMGGKMTFAEIETDRGTLIYEGELSVGTEVFIVREDELPSIAPDDTYSTDKQRITVSDGRVTEIENIDGSEGNAPVEVTEITEDVVSILEDAIELIESLVEMNKQYRTDIDELKKKGDKLEAEFSAMKSPRTSPIEKKPGTRQGNAPKNYMEYVQSKKNK